MVSKKNKVHKTKKKKLLNSPCAMVARILSLCKNKNKNYKEINKKCFK
jgi:hypothetical protein